MVTPPTASAGTDPDGNVVALTIGNNIGNYDIAYNPDRDEYMVVYQRDLSTVGVAEATRLSSDGTVLGSTVIPKADDFISSGRWSPSVAYDDVNDRFLVATAHRTPASVDTPSSFYIQGQLLTGTGLLAGSPATISPPYAPNCQVIEPSVEAVPQDGGFMLLTILWSRAADGVCDGLDNLASRTVLQPVSATLAPGARVNVPGSNLEGEPAFLAVNSATGQFAVTQFDDADNSSELHIYGPDLNLINSQEFALPTGIGGGVSASYFAAGDPVTGNWLHTVGVSAGGTVITRIFGTDGAQIGDVHSSPGGLANSATAVGDGTFLVSTNTGRLIHFGGNGAELSISDDLDFSFDQESVVAANGSATDPKAMMAGASTSLGSNAALAYDVDTPSIQNLTPGRILDTRPAGRTVDNEAVGGPKPGAGSVTELQVAGRGGVPTNASAVALNLTVAQPESNGFVTAFPCDESQPGSSNLNYASGATVANSVVAKLSATGTVCLFTSADTHLLADVSGFVPQVATATPLVPARLLETRETPNAATIDGMSLGGGQVDAGSVTRFMVAGRGGVPTDASSVLLNITSVNGQTGGFLTAYSCDQSQPDASTLNAPAGGNVANVALVELGASGEVCIFSSAATHLLADVTAAMAPDAELQTLQPARLFDGRATGETVDGDQRRGGQVAAGSVTMISVGGRADIPGARSSGDPTAAKTAVLNITSVRAETGGFFTVYACDDERPNSSNLNFAEGQIVANFVTVNLDFFGRACVYSSAQTDLIVDVIGWTS